MATAGPAGPKISRSGGALAAIAAVLCVGPEARAAAAGAKPHIVLHLADDFGWANAGWHRPEGYREVQTPSMDALVKAGIELDHAYSYMFCSPTRSSLQSGRLPVHVNVLNLQPTTWNAHDPVSGFAGIPRNSESGPSYPPQCLGRATNLARSDPASLFCPRLLPPPLLPP